MSIIGNPIISTDFPKDTFSGNGSTTAFTMSIAPASVNAVIVVVSGITQDPSTYTISGTTLTFSAAPPTGTSNISVRHLGVAGIPNTPSAGSVVATSIADGVITAAKFASGQTPAFNGIAFPATQSASADANTLDDYEEGTWTPTLNANLTGAAGYTAGQYVKIGQMCYLNYSLKVGTVSGGNAVTITLPFTSASSFTNGSSDQGAMIYTGGPDTGDIGTLAYISGNNTMIELYQTSDNAGGAQLTNSQLAVNDFLFVNLCYRTA